MSRPLNDDGFSVVEALVALFVFAIAGVGLMQLQTESLRTLTQVESRVLAQTLAQNRLTEIVAARAKPALGASEDVADFAGRSWRVGAEIVATSDPAIRRVSVTVRATEGQETSIVAHAFFAVQEGAP